MPIDVRFDKAGFYHPAYGRMGRGKFAGKVYSLPDIFREAGMLPATAEIIDDKEVLEEVLEDEEQRKPIKPKVVDEEQLKRTEKAASAGSRRRPPVRSGTRKASATKE